MAALTEDHGVDSAGSGAAASKATAPEPDAPEKPEGPEDLHKTSWKYVAKRALNEFGKDECTFLAAGLTYYSVLALFPALLALLSLVGVFGQGQQTVNTLLDLGRQLRLGSFVENLEGPITQLVNSRGAGLALITGLLGALWSASGYVLNFGKAMNRIYEIDEGRPVWKLRPVVYLITAVLVLMAAAVLLGLVVSGPVAQAVGDTIGLGDQAVTTWSIVKWPVILVVVILMVAILFHFAPNVQQPKFKWISVGAAVAILIWILASVAFGIYVSNFGSYNKTYGTLAGVIIFLLWLWLTNTVLLLGVEIDAELERGRQLQGGIRAEESLQLPPRDDSASKKRAKKAEELVEQGRQIRLNSPGDVDEDGFTRSARDDEPKA
ncbi:YihY/virulence factor BrkB family protein [Aestuariimicrobium sp. p3-SID1156]|uniref:YihY/virulence factor BrkB family protein n=1 Tax=Aestuariimicrobium sp. p3-SID1156 TaxID=2916038 RepID=UPI00223AF806|nr:YihY/virulence factor BrkB family protein [Aestuariimicrobium sp. p3-SID1156]MCT1458120.1 YihY/virulence factor BrkB family protein [Aestuariimicrobium sp. p3-SID1156]